MSESLSLFENGEFKSKEELLRLHEEAQWKLIMSRLDRSVGILAPIEFLNGGGLLKKNAERLRASNYDVYQAKEHFTARYIGDEVVNK